MTGTSPNAISLPSYIALGTGTGTATDLDKFLFKEGYQARAQYTALTSPQAFTGQVSTTFVASSNITWTEVGIFDQPAPTTALTANAASGATNITVTPVTFTIPSGQPMYLVDDGISEYVYAASSVAPNTALIPLQSGLINSHNSSIPVVIFAGNMFSHLVLTTAFQQIAGEALTVQWQFQVS